MNHVNLVNSTCRDSISSKYQKVFEKNENDNEFGALEGRKRNLIYVQRILEPVFFAYIIRSFAARQFHFQC